MTHPPTDPQPLDVIARELHEHNRRRIESFPAWEDLDMSDPWHAGLIRLAYDRARDFVAMNGGTADRRRSAVLYDAEKWASVMSAS